MNTLADYVGIPYLDKGDSTAGADCWGLASLVLANVYGRQVPDHRKAYVSAQNGRSVARAVTRILVGQREGWAAIDRPSEGDLLILRAHDMPWHCAVLCEDGWFIHAPGVDRNGRPKLSCRERLDGAEWRNRLMGAYRHA